LNSARGPEQEIFGAVRIVANEKQFFLSIFLVGKLCLDEEDSAYTAEKSAIRAVL